MIQIPLRDTNRFLSKITKGDLVKIEVKDNESYNVLFKDISHHPVTRQVEHIEFQHIVADEPVNSVANVTLANREMNQNLIQQHIEEIPYNALPKDFIQDIVIDVRGMEAGTNITVGDLDAAKDEKIKILIPEDTVVLTVSEPVKVQIDDEEVDTETESESQEQES